MPTHVFLLGMLEGRVEAALCSGPGEAILPLARPSTIPRARAAVKGAKANSFGILRAISELHQKQMTSVICGGKKMNTDPYFQMRTQKGNSISSVFPRNRSRDAVLVRVDI